MIVYKTPSNIKHYTSVSEIPDVVWCQLGCSKNQYFHPKFLAALADSHTTLRFSYLVLFDENNQAIAFATIQIIDFYLNRVQNSMQHLVEKAAYIGGKIGVINPKKPFKILLCGNAFISGEHGIFIKQDQDKKKVVKQLSKALANHISKQYQLKDDINAYMLKDFEIESLSITDEWHDEDFYSFQVEPNMQLHVNRDWCTFDDYLASLKTKYRVKARKALKESALLQVKPITVDTIDSFLPKMKELYQKVVDSSNFNFSDFNLDTFKLLKQNLDTNYAIDAYFLNNQLVGFLSGMHNQQAFDAHFVGIDYDLNRKHYIYQRMLYDYIKKAIEQRVSVLNFGRTAAEIKSSVGAVPQHLTIYLRHKKSIPNQILKLFLKQISPTPFYQHQPFKAKDLATDT